MHSTDANYRRQSHVIYKMLMSVLLVLLGTSTALAKPTISLQVEKNSAAKHSNSSTSHGDKITWPCPSKAVPS